MCFSHGHMSVSRAFICGLGRRSSRADIRWLRLPWPYRISVGDGSINRISIRFRFDLINRNRKFPALINWNWINLKFYNRTMTLSRYHCVVYRELCHGQKLRWVWKWLLTGTVYPGVMWEHIPLEDNNANTVTKF